MAVIREQKTICGSEYMEIDLYHVTEAVHRKAARARKARESSQALKNCNARKARRYLKQLVAANFKQGSCMLVHLTYKDEYLPDNIESAHRDIVNFIKKINRRCAALGAPKAKYITVCEWQEANPKDGTKEVRFHHHMILECALSQNEIKDCWRVGSGKWSEARGLVKADRAEFEHGTLEAYCAYITKWPRRGRRWWQSKGLKRPVLLRPNDSRYTEKKLAEAATIHADDAEHWEKLYGVQHIQGQKRSYAFTGQESYYNEASGQWHVILTFWADPRRQERRKRKQKERAG